MKTVTLPIICSGRLLEVPIDDILVEAYSLTYEVVFKIPTGVAFDHAVLDKGSYDDATNTWSMNSVQKGELLQGFFYFTVTDDSKAPFDFKYTPKDLQEECVRVEGLTCYDLSCCETAVIARDSEVVVPKGQTLTDIDVSTNDDECTSRTYQWLTDAGGTVTGTPTSATFTPDASFCGTKVAEYGLYCNGKLKDTARLFIRVSCAAPTTQWFTMPPDTIFAGNVAVADLICTEGADSTFHLKDAPTANGGVTYATNTSDCTVTDWNQVTGNFQLTCINGYTGLVYFEYFIRCTANSLSYDTGAGQQVVNVTSDFPFSSSVPVSSSAAASSSAAPSSSGLFSSSAAASSSATSSLAAASSSAAPSSSVALAPSSSNPTSSSVPYSSSQPVSSSAPVSSGVPASSSFTFLSSSAIPSSSPVASSSNEPSSSNISASSSATPSSSAP